MTAGEASNGGWDDQALIRAYERAVRKFRIRGETGRTNDAAELEPGEVEYPADSDAKKRRLDAPEDEEQPRDGGKYHRANGAPDAALPPAAAIPEPPPPPPMWQPRVVAADGAQQPGPGDYYGRCGACQQHDEETQALESMLNASYWAGYTRGQYDQIQRLKGSK